jgi:UDP-glucose 4-epimerase
MTVLLTGATGFLGSAVLRRLAGRTEVVALHRPGAVPAQTFDGVHWLPADLAGPRLSGLPDRIDAVLHLAHSRRYREFPDGVVDVHEVNAAATVRLLDYCRRAGGRSFIYGSSGAVYRAGPAPLSEDDVPVPDSFYAASKLAGEQAVEQFRTLLAAHSLRFFFVYGPCQRNRFIAGLIERVRRGEAVALAGPEGIRVNPVYVDDAAAAVTRTLELRRPQTLNVAGPRTASVREIAEALGRLLGRTPRFAIGDPQPDLVASVKRQCEVLGPPVVDIAEGLRRTIEAG